VEALTLEHQGGNLEVACNLLDSYSTSPEAVLAVATQKAVELGIRIDTAYRIGMGPEEILSETQRMLNLRQKR